MTDHSHDPGKNEHLSNALKSNKTNENTSTSASAESTAYNLISTPSQKTPPQILQDGIKQMQRTHGNAATAQWLQRQPIIQRDPPAAPSVTAASAKGSEGASVKLQTALDSKVSVGSSGGGLYTVGIDLENVCLLIANYEIRTQNANLRYLPVYIEDIVTDRMALVRILFDSNVAVVKTLVKNQMFGNQRIQVEAIPTSADQLRTQTASKARDVGPGYVSEGKENVTKHSGAGELDKIMGSVASAEGGFASTEGSDQGIFTWGQGQWTVGADLLQPVLQFIKNKRADLFERYWGSAGLDIRENIFHYQGKSFAGKAKLRKLFRSSKQQNLFWVNVFAQAGEDPQIQRLQREYQRGEVEEQLDQQISGKSPSGWLDTRGKAFYYSMWVNLPSVAHSTFKKAIQKAGKATEPTNTIRQTISTELESLFKNSGVMARSGDKHHYIAFWGETGRNKAIAEADERINDPSLDQVWSTEKWKKHKVGMQKRQSRYEKTKIDINKALARQDVEPDIPAEVGEYFSNL